MTLKILVAVVVFFLSVPGVAAPYYDYVGCVHIHTVYSDGTGTFEEVASAARQAGLDFIITSDHHTLKPLRDRKEGYYEGMLVLVGVEITIPGGHYLAMGLPGDFSCSELDTQQCIDAVKAVGGLGFLAHPKGRWEWTDWSVSGYNGIEVVNLAALARRDAFSLLMKGFRTLLGTEEAVMMNMTQRRPDEVLNLWDSLLMQGKVVGIGSVDAHARINIRGRIFKRPRYEESFRALQTHVLADRPLTGDVAEDKQTVYSALRAGRTYITYGRVGRSPALQFTAKAGARMAVMGESVGVGEEPVTLRFALPSQEFGIVTRLLHNGRQVRRGSGQTLTYEAHEPGVYRVEVYRNYRGSLRPWIFTNPIYLTSAEE